MTLPIEVEAPVCPDRRHLVTDSVRRDLRPLVPAVVVAVVWLVWIGASGGYAAETWYPSALGMMSLWVAVLAFGGTVLPKVRAARIGLLLFAALVALNYLSILWAQSPGSALDASNELALYLFGAWIFAVLPWTPRALVLVLGVWSAGVCVFCAVTLVHATGASSLTQFFINGRFSTPMQYSNATGAVAVMGMWPALILSSRRELPFWLRGACLGVAAFLAGFSTLPQSRAVLLGLAVTAPVALVASSDRLRLLVRMAIVGGALAICLPRTVAVDNAVNAGANVTPVLKHAASGMLLTSLAAVLLGLLVALLEQRFAADHRLPGRRVATRARSADRPRLTSRRAVRDGLAAAALVVIIVAAVIAEPKVVHLANTVVTKGTTDASTGSVRLLSASPEERFDYDRAALHLFSGAPLLGVGSGNFGRHYDALRRFVKHSQYTHNLPLRVLSETGLVGALVFVLLVGTLVVGMALAARRRNDLGRACVVIAFCISGYFLVHSCLDWVDEFPALAAPAIALPLAAICAAMGRTAAAEDPNLSAGRRGPSLATRRAVAGALGSVVAVAVLVALATSYLSLRLVDRAFASFRAAPGQAYRDLSRAGSLNPLSANPITSEGTIALYVGDMQRSLRAFERSVRQEDAWYPRLELALIDAHTGRFKPALRQIDAAIRLDADDPLMEQARQTIIGHHRIDPYSFNRQVLQEGNVTTSIQETIR